MLWVVRVELWLPAELSSQVGHTAWEDWLGAAGYTWLRSLSRVLPLWHAPTSLFWEGNPSCYSGYSLDCFPWGQVAIRV